MLIRKAEEHTFAEILTKLGFKYVFEDVHDVRDVEKAVNYSKLRDAVIQRIDENSVIALAYHLGKHHVAPGINAVVELKRRFGWESDYGYHCISKIAEAVKPDIAFKIGYKYACIYYRSANLLICTSLYADDAGHNVFREVLEFLLSLGDQEDSDTPII